MVVQASTALGIETACAEVSGIECISRSRYHSAVAARRAGPEPLLAVILPSPLGWTSAKQSPPMPVDCGSITPNSAHAATAASAAVPPERITSIAVSAASGCEVATIAFWAWTVERPARWKFLMKTCSLVFLSLFLGPDYMAHSCSAGQWAEMHNGRPSAHLLILRSGLKGRVSKDGPRTHPSRRAQGRAPQDEVETVFPHPPSPDKPLRCPT